METIKGISIADGNKLIFMFLNEWSLVSKCTPLIKESHGAYHVSWDWLMRAVEKIKVTQHLTKEHQIIIKNHKTKIVDNEGELVTYHKGNDALYNTWYCVVDFINWYNKK